MFRVALFLCCLALCHGHAVLPLVVPAAHSLHGPLLAPVGLHGYGGYGLYSHGLVAKPLGHHILKRSPHLVAPLAHGALGHAGLGHAGLGHVGLGHVAPIAHVAPVVAPVAHVAPVAVSHQSRVDVRTSPAVVSTAVLPVVKPVVAPVVAPVVHAAPLLHKPLIGGYLGGHLGGHLGGLEHGYASVYPHLGHY